MKKTKFEKDPLKAEYDFSTMKGGVRGKYYKQYRKGHNLILLEPDVAKIFPDAASVNQVLRTLVKLVPGRAHLAHK